MRHPIYDRHRQEHRQNEPQPLVLELPLPELPSRDPKRDSQVSDESPRGVWETEI